MSYRVLMWAVAAVLLVSAVVVVAELDLIRERREGPIFIASDGPISEEQVRQKVTADGWTDVMIKREGRYFQVMGLKDQQTSHLVVDSQTGRLRLGDDDDD